MVKHLPREISPTPGERCLRREHTKPVGDLAEKLKSIYRTEGVFGAVRRGFVSGCRRAFSYSSSEEIISAKDLTEKSRTALKAQLVVRALEPSDRPLVAAFHERHGVEPNQRDRVGRYFDHGHKAFLAFSGDELIGYIFWVDNDAPAADRHPHIRIYDIPLKNDEVYAFDFYIAPVHRGGSRAVEFLDRVHQCLAEAGYKKAYGFVIASKRPARWVYATLGYKVIRSVTSHKIFGSIGVLGGRVFLAKDNKF